MTQSINITFLLKMRTFRMDVVPKNILSLPFLLSGKQKSTGLRQVRLVLMLTCVNVLPLSITSKFPRNPTPRFLVTILLWHDSHENLRSPGGTVTRFLQLVQVGYMDTEAFTISGVIKVGDNFALASDSILLKSVMSMTSQFMLEVAILSDG